MENVDSASVNGQSISFSFDNGVLDFESGSIPTDLSFSQADADLKVQAGNSWVILSSVSLGALRDSGDDQIDGTGWAAFSNPEDAWISFGPSAAVLLAGVDPTQVNAGWFVTAQSQPLPGT